MRISQNGIDFIKKFEGCILKAYNDGVGVCTIGYGHTGSDVWYGKVISNAEAEKLLTIDLKRFENYINSLGLNLNQNQFDAMVSFTFNCGTGALGDNYNTGRCLRNGDYAGLCNAMLSWCNGSPAVHDGLLRRRKAEIELFNRSCQPSKPADRNIGVKNNNIGEMFDMSRKFINGKSDEILYNDNLHEVRVGWLRPHEECKCIGIHSSGHGIVIYEADNGYDKVGFTTCHVALGNDGVVRPID